VPSDVPHVAPSPLPTRQRCIIFHAPELLKLSFKQALHRGHRSKAIPLSVRAAKMANNHEAGGSGDGRGRGRGVGVDEPPAPVLWPRSLIVPLAYEVAAFDLLMPPYCHLL
jgi:hypothetical protein